MSQNEYVRSPSDHQVDGMYFSTINEPAERKGSVFVEYSKEGIYDIADGGTFVELDSNISTCISKDTNNVRHRSKTYKIILSLLVILLLIVLVSFGIYYAGKDKQIGKQNII